MDRYKETNDDFYWAWVFSAQEYWRKIELSEQDVNDLFNAHCGGGEL